MQSFRVGIQNNFIKEDYVCLMSFNYLKKKKKRDFCLKNLESVFILYNYYYFSLASPFCAISKFLVQKSSVESLTLIWLNYLSVLL